MSIKKDQFVEKIYLGEVLFQIEYALIGWRDAHEALKSHNTLRVFCSLHTFLTHVGNVSKVFWPSRADGDWATQRGERLRSKLGVSGQYAIARRQLRNHLEHYDTRLDKWATDNRRSGYADSNIGPATGFRPNVMRNYDPKSETYAFQGESYDLADFHSEMMSLREQVVDYLKKTRHGCQLLLALDLLLSENRS